MKKVLLLVLLLIPFNVFALAEGARSSVLMDFDTGTVLYESESDKEAPPASMTKMMSLLLIFEALDNNQIHLDDEVMISKKAQDMGGSQVYLEAGKSMRLEELLKSVCIASANDSITALAEFLYGSTDTFVNMMNEKAKVLGLKHTSFLNVHGLDQKGHYSSAYDMAVIARELLKHPDVLKYSSIYEDHIKHPNGESIWIVNTNKLINSYKGLDGLKTGYTEGAGYSLTATAKRGNMRLISVVMGYDTSNHRNDGTTELLNYGFSNYKLSTLVKKNEVVGSARIKFGKVDKSDLVLMDDATDLVSILENREYSYKLNVDVLKAPIKYGEIVGTFDVRSNGVLLKSYNVTVKEDIKKANILDLYINNLKRLLTGF